MARIIVADDEPGICSFVAEVLERAGHDVTACGDGEAAYAEINKHGVDLVVTDIKMPKMDGIELLTRVRAEQPDVEIIVMTAHGTVETAVKAMKAGAFDYLEKPLSGPAELRLTAERALERRALRSLREQVDMSRGGDEGLPLSYGAPAMKPVIHALEKVASTNASVLLLGPSGTGKEVAARRIHAWSERSQEAFVAINCAALSDALLESELFGHEKGAFTGAVRRQRGRLELAQRGTFFLDEIGELKLELQAKLLRLLQEKTFQRVGGTQVLTADVRFIAATNRDLAAMVREGGFRQDLYHRLAVFPVQLPPLEQRREDIPKLAEAAFARVKKELGRKDVELSAEAIEALAAMPWPGNIRQLRNTLERALILADGDRIEPQHILADPGMTPDSPPAPDGIPDVPLAELERLAIEAALERCAGNRTAAAKRLGIAVRTLYDRIKRYETSS